MAVHRPLSPQQHPPAPRAALPAVPQALPARHRLPAAAAEGPEVQGPLPGHRQQAKGLGAALRRALATPGVWDKSLGEEDLTAQQLGPVPEVT